jgi:hypothetical protein
MSNLVQNNARATVAANAATTSVETLNALPVQMLSGRGHLPFGRNVFKAEGAKGKAVILEKARAAEKGRGSQRNSWEKETFGMMPLRNLDLTGIAVTVSANTVLIAVSLTMDPWGGRRKENLKLSLWLQKRGRKRGKS